MYTMSRLGLVSLVCVIVCLSAGLKQVMRGVPEPDYEAPGNSLEWCSMFFTESDCLVNTLGSEKLHYGDMTLHFPTGCLWHGNQCWDPRAFVNHQRTVVFYFLIYTLLAVALLLVWELYKEGQVFWDQVRGMQTVIEANAEYEDDDDEGGEEEDNKNGEIGEDRDQIPPLVRLNELDGYRKLPDLDGETGNCDPPAAVPLDEGVVEVETEPKPKMICTVISSRRIAIIHPDAKGEPVRAFLAGSAPTYPRAKPFWKQELDIMCSTQTAELLSVEDHGLVVPMNQSNRTIIEALKYGSWVQLKWMIHSQIDSQVKMLVHGPALSLVTEGGTPVIDVFDNVFQRYV